MPVVKETLYTAELHRRRNTAGVIEPFPVSTKTQIVGRCADHCNAVALLRMRINRYLQRTYTSTSSHSASPTPRPVC